jgi:hypothetical protein
MPFSPLVDPYAELNAFNPGNESSRNAGSLLKYLQSLQVYSIIGHKYKDVKCKPPDLPLQKGGIMRGERGDVMNHEERHLF